MADPNVPIIGTVAASFVFLRRNALDILRHVWIPALLGCGVLYLSVVAYLRELLVFLGDPTDAHASLVLAVAGVSLLLLLFTFAMTAAAVAQLALGYKQPGEPLRIGHCEYRLYAATLRFFLVIIALFIPAGLFVALMTYLWPDLQPVAAGLTGLGLFAMAVRVGFLLPAVAAATPQGTVLRRSWSLSRGAFWRLAAIGMILLLPGLALELAGEWLGRLAGIFPSSSGVTLQSHIALFREVGPGFSILLAFCLLLTVLLQTAASVTAYGILNNSTAPQ